jgi:alkylation response protein AidB-like acyl-CoA dehydrogenase
MTVCQAVGRGARAEVAALCQPGREADAAAANARLRGTCNDLALRVTHAAVALYKGAALLRDHPAQRLAREAMFLLVWSCPNPVIDCTVDLLSEGH